MIAGSPTNRVTVATSVTIIISNGAIVNSSQEYIQCYIRGSMIPGYENYCPLTQRYAYLLPDGTYLVDGLDDMAFEAGDLVIQPGFLVVQLGLIERDYTVETASNALFNSLQSLFATCNIPVDFERMRTTVELSEYMKRYRANYSHLILIGHGTTEGIPFLDKRNPIAGAELAGCLGSDASEKDLQIISLCCHSGCANLARALSLTPHVTEVIAPNGTFDMRWAVHFVTGFLLYQFINNDRVDEAVRNAARNSGNAPMCIWRNGELAGSCAK